jgi:hypothetical protein
MVAVVWSLWISPIAEGLAADRLAITAARTRLQRAQSLIAAMPTMQIQLKRLAASQLEQRMLFQGSDPALLAAGFQRVVQEIVGHAGTDLGNSETEPVRQQGQFLRLGLQLTLTSSASGLQRLLYAIETAAPLIIIDHLSIKVPESGVELGQDLDGQPELNISLELSAYANGSPALEPR